MRDLIGRCWIAKIIIVIALVVLLTPVAIHAQDLNTDLFKAIARGDTATVEKLLSKGADVNAKEQYGGTALMGASQLGHTEIVEMLLSKGADVNVKDKDNWTALMYVSEKGHTEIVEMLLSKGADVNAKTKYGGTALMAASEKGHTKIVEMLRAKGTDVRKINIYDSNPTCRKKKEVGMRIKKGWEDIRHSKGVIHWLFNLIYNLLLLPGRIILWIIYSIGCWLGI